MFLQVVHETTVRLYADEYMYLDSIRWIFDVCCYYLVYSDVMHSLSP